MHVALIATLDTKGDEAAFVRDQLKSAGVDVLLIDVGSVGPPSIPPDIARNEVFPAIPTDRGAAVTLAARGVAILVRRLHDAGRIDGVLGIGGSAGTTIASAAMRALPLGVPKVMVSTLASGQVQPYVGVRDVCMMPAIADIAGLNRITRMVLTRAAGAMAGMLAAKPSAVAEKPLVTATMFGVTTPAVTMARQRLEAAGLEVVVFHATGAGGRTMEGMIADGLVAGVLDLTTTELADELVGGVLTAGPDRLTGAGLRKVPQVISVGALDMVNFGPVDTVPAKFEGRRFHVHNPTVTLMRTTPEENDRLGKEIAEKASASGGPTTVLLPLRGVSALDAEGKPFWWPEADRALFDSIRQWIGPWVRVVEMDAHINDESFAAIAADELRRMIG